MLSCGHCREGLTFGMSGGWKRAKPAGGRPLDEGVKRHDRRPLDRLFAGVIDVREAPLAPRDAAGGQLRYVLWKLAASRTSRVRVYRNEAALLQGEPGVHIDPVFVPVGFVQAIERELHLRRELQCWHGRSFRWPRGIRGALCSKGPDIFQQRVVKGIFGKRGARLPGEYGRNLLDLAGGSRDCCSDASPATGGSRWPTGLPEPDFTASPMTGCGVRRDKAALFQWVKAPPGKLLQPEAPGATMEATKWLKPLGKACHDIR